MTVIKAQTKFDTYNKVARSPPNMSGTNPPITFKASVVNESEYLHMEMKV